MGYETMMNISIFFKRFFLYTLFVFYVMKGKKLRKMEKNTCC